MKKLQSAALLLDFWLGQGVRAAAIPAAVLSRPSNAGQAKKTRNPVGESKKGRLAALPARLQPAAGMRRALACALPYGLSCSRAALSNFFTGSQSKRRIIRKALYSAGSSFPRAAPRFGRGGSPIPGFALWRMVLFCSRCCMNCRVPWLKNPLACNILAGLPGAHEMPGGAQVHG